MYVKNARRYVEKSLRTKEQALAEERAEDLYIEIRNDMKLGKSFFAISIKEGVADFVDKDSVPFVLGEVKPGTKPASLR